MRSFTSGVKPSPHVQVLTYFLVVMANPTHTVTVVPPSSTFYKHIARNTITNNIIAVFRPSGLTCETFASSLSAVRKEGTESPIGTEAYTAHDSSRKAEDAETWHPCECHSSGKRRSTGKEERALFCLKGLCCDFVRRWASCTSQALSLCVDAYFRSCTYVWPSGSMT